MDSTTLDWLRSPAGQAVLAELAAAPLGERDVLPTLSRLRARYPAELARAAVEQAMLRQRARAKFRHAERLYFTREALEQASSAPVAAHRARRLASHVAHVVEVGCGIGGDTLALAEAGCRVSALERDPQRLALAQANAEALGLADRIRFVQADALREPLPSADALFCDPARRTGGTRHVNPEHYAPPISAVLGWRGQFAALAAKLAPGIDTDALGAAPPAAVEFVSLDGELKEAMLWCGPLAETSRRATLLSSSGPPASLTDATTPPAPPLAPPAAILYEPDPAVIRAGLVAHLAERLGAAQLDPTIAYLTADTAQPTPFARAWPICEWLPFGLKRLRARLRALDAGAVTVKKRGSPLDTDKLARQLSGSGAHPLVVVLTQVQGQHAALICEPPADIAKPPA
jgi:SAM-dependent methyltransferase